VLEPTAARTPEQAEQTAAGVHLEAVVASLAQHRWADQRLVAAGGSNSGHSRGIKGFIIQVE
jgi:hypothetical protein